MGAGGVGRRIEVSGTTTSAWLMVIVCSTATCWSRVTRIVYVPGANAIPGTYGWALWRASVTIILLSAGVGSTVRPKVRGGGSGCKAIRSVTSAVRIVIARSWGTKPSRVTRIVYVPGANAIPGM